ncbi:MAG: diguanylate cyclase [Gammaproteobacteria bacterium]|nr:diguanylate cyclase [Gammaproteobacteria bacterium]
MTSQSELDFERINRIYDNSTFAYLGVVISVFFLGSISYHFASAELTFYWVILVFLSNIPRLLTSQRFSKKIKNHEINLKNVKPWEKYFFISSILPFVSFCSVVFMPFKENVLVCVLFCTMINICMVCGTLLTYCTTRSIMWLHLSLFILTPVVRLLWLGGTVPVLLACYLLIAYFMIMRLAKSQNEIFVENISMKIDSKNQSLLDPLTGLSNRRRLYLFVEKLIPASYRNGDSFSLILLDIDYFKEFNDKYGHISGDELLVSLSAILIDCSREQDLVVRYGGEEFMLVLPSTNLEQAILLTDRIQLIVRDKLKITISAGLAEYRDETSFDQLIKVADNALYKAKEGGRDRYQVA